MIKIAHIHQLASIRGLPDEVMNAIHEAVSILDNEYGVNRDVDSGDGIFFFLAMQQVQVAKGSKMPRNPVVYDYYQRKVKDGKTKMQALVCVMRRLVNIIHSMMKNKTAYVMPTLQEKEVA